MKLNLGCGKSYQDGFINIDAFDTTVADKSMSVLSLEFPSNTVDEIRASHIIEHLGYINSTFALAEWFRVLKPQGLLLIETPDIETSFRNYAAGDYETKKGLLSWIYGTGSKGMQHKLCFPELLIENLLLKSGFSEIKTSFITFEKYPALKIYCEKPKQYTIHQIISEYRKKLNTENLVHTECEIIALEQEKLIDFFIEELFRYTENNDFRVIDKIILNGCIRNVEMTKILLQECINQKILIKNKLKRRFELMDFLISINFLDILMYLVEKSPVVAGNQVKVIEAISNFGKQSIIQLLSKIGKESAVRNSLITLSKKNNDGKIVFFSDKILEYKSAKFSYMAIKDFYMGKYDEAILKLKKATGLERNHILYFWNLGRLLMLIGNQNEAKKWYKGAIDLVRTSDFENIENIKSTIMDEMTNFSSLKYGKPIVEVKY